MKTRIFLDTNKVYTDKEESLKEIFNSNISRLNKFIKDNNVGKNVAVCLPEVVVKERIQQKIENIKFTLDGANQRIKHLGVMGHKNRQIKPRKDYKKVLAKNAQAFIKAESVEVVPTPKIESDALIERAIHKIKPFKSKDTGFKDSLIFLTLIDDALRVKADTYVLCTENVGDFSDEVKTEFKTKTGKDLIIASGVIELEEVLDNLYTLRLKRKERDELIKNLVFKKIGEIMLAINKHDNKNDQGWFTNSPIRIQHPINSVWMYGAQEDESKIVGYDFKDGQISDILETSTDTFQISLKVETQIRREDENKDPYSQVFTVNTLRLPDLYGFRNNSKSFLVQLDCNIANGDFKIRSVNSRF